MGNMYNYNTNSNTGPVCGGKTPEQIIRKLKEAEVKFYQGKTISQATRQIGIVNQTYYKWLNI